MEKNSHQPTEQQPTKRKQKTSLFHYMKHHSLRMVCYLLVICAAVAGYYIGSDRIEAYYDEEEAVQTAAKVEVNQKLESALDAKEQKRIAAEKKAEEERIEAARIEAERIAAEKKAEEERIAAEKKKAEEARIAAAKKAEEKRKAELEAQKQRQEEAKKAAEKAEVIAAEKAKAAAEKAERGRISAQIKAQEAVALAEQAEYEALAPEAIVNLNVTNILQKPELPNGCEITALAILLNYKGYYAEKGWLADNFLAQFPFYSIGTQRAGGNPDYYFCGNPRKTSNAYYCFAGPIADAGNKYMATAGAPYQAIDITGTDEQGLIDQLNSGNPVITWGTLSMGDAFTYSPNAWVYNENGDKHVPFLNLHCVVLYGYDDTFFYFADPLRGNVAYKRSTFMNAYRQIGSRSVIII